ncbi:MAG: hypothetical protein IJG08_05100 [Oscillospiraceae bacterium]|nr:hypothetical protein [Oscillospiraceae bacterium]
MKHIEKAVRAFRAAYHRRRIVQIQRKMERQYLRGASLSSEQMVRWSMSISKHCIHLQRVSRDGSFDSSEIRMNQKEHPCRRVAHKRHEEKEGRPSSQDICPFLRILRRR